MLSSITPLGQRGTARSWRRTVISFWIGALATGALAYGAVGLLGQLLGIADAPEWIPLAVLAVSALLDASHLSPAGPKRQVNENWLGAYRDWVTGLGYGTQLGTGWLTIVPIWGVWTLVFVSALVPNPTAFLIGISFAAGRSALLFIARDVDRPERLASMMAGLVRYDRPVMRLVLGGYAAAILLGAIRAS
jgi:hypothetical protein